MLHNFGNFLTGDDLSYITSTWGQIDLSDEDMFVDKPLDPSLQNVEYFFLYNSQSGNLSASAYANTFQDICEEESIKITNFTLHDFDSELFKAYFLTARNPIIIIGGGDGTICWALSKVIKVVEKYNLRYPQFTILPLGSGNDLSRETGWGYEPVNANSKECSNYLRELNSLVFKNSIQLIDRWKINWEFVDEEDKFLTGTQTDTLPEHFICYMGVGMDAQIAYKLGFKRLNSANGNFLMHGLFGAQEIFQPSPCLGNIVSARVPNSDEGTYPDEPLSFSSSYRCIKLLNISSCEGGCNMWGNGDSKPFDPCQICTVPRCDDRCLELIGTRSIYQHLFCRMNLHRAERITQIKDSIIWELREATHVQADGEAFYVSPCTIKMSHCDQIPFIKKI